SILGNRMIIVTSGLLELAQEVAWIGQPLVPLRVPEATLYHRARPCHKAEPLRRPEASALAHGTEVSNEGTPRRLYNGRILRGAAHLTLCGLMCRATDHTMRRNLCAQMPEPIGARWTLFSTSLTPSIRRILSTTPARSP